MNDGNCVTHSHPKHLCNQLDRDRLIAELEREPYDRRTVSFYLYTEIKNPEALRHELYLAWEALGVKGRIYLAEEGVNAQASVPEPTFDRFVESVRVYFGDIPIKLAREENGLSFLKLTIKAKRRILADGLPDGTYDTSNVGKHLTAREWNDAMAGAIVVDVRNHYESEVGHFQGALLPDVDSFREELPVILNMLSGKEDEKILLYCTGGIRCEKTSAWLKSNGFKDVNQLHGGIVDYDAQVKEQGLENKFIGKNFVFDGRMGERITEEVIGRCHTCGDQADTHINCAWQVCHVLFIQCPSCQEKMQGCCGDECKTMQSLPEAEKIALRKAATPNAKTFMKGRFRSSKAYEHHNLQQQGSST